VWVEGGDIHDELLDQLGAVLTAPQAAGSGDTPGSPGLTLTPSAAEFEALAAAVAARWPDGATAPAEAAPSAAGVRAIRPAGRRPLRRLGSGAWRAGSVAAGIVVFSASAAAAANGGVPLPRPVRVVAYTVGLPVDSPALDDTNQHIEDLKEAVKANDAPKAEATVRRLQTDLKKVPGHEKKEAEKKVQAVMEEVRPQIAAATSTTTTTVPPAPPTTATAPGAASSTTATTAGSGQTDKDADKDKGAVTTTTRPATTTTEPEPTTTTTAPETDETPSDEPPTGEPGTGDPGHGGAGGGGGDQGSTTPTTTPDGGTTTTTIPDGGGSSGGGDPGSTTTTSSSSTTTTTMPPTDPGAGTP
jgi:hypothetical protein